MAPRGRSLSSPETARSGLRASRSSLVLLALVFLLSPTQGQAMCDVIPGVTQEFRGALGSVNRPFAIPGDEGEVIALRLKRDPSQPGHCDDPTLPGFSEAASDHVVTIVFEPPNGPRNAVILSTDCTALAPALTSCSDQLASGSATCVEVNTPENPFGLAVVDRPGAPRELRFRFPDTDDRVGTPDDERTLTGPATIAVTAAGSPLPCGLATARCTETAGLLACVDELYVPGGCGTGSAHVDPIFGSFTALPPANRYESLCTTPGSECAVAASELRFALDAAGNALVPVDWRAVRLHARGVPLARLVRGETTFAAFSGGDPVQIPGRSFLASYSAGGQKLPPIFEPLSDPASPATATLFGTVDAELGVIRLARRMPDLSLQPPAYRQCAGEPPRPCVTDADCGSGACGPATCQDLPQTPVCTADAECGGGECGPALFDFSDRLAGDIGPVVVPNTAFSAEAGSAVPLEGLIETQEMFAFVQLEDPTEGSGDGPSASDLNGDADTTDAVLVLRDRQTGTAQPIGELGSLGRATTRVRQPRQSFYAVTAEDDIVAFLEPEPLQGDCSTPSNCDTNADGDVFDTLLRVYRVGSGGAVELTPTGTSSIVIDAAPRLDGRSVFVSDGLVFFRTPEAAGARLETTRVSVDSQGGEGNGRSAHFVSISADGRFVAFWSQASNFDPNDGPCTVGFEPSCPDHFVHDRETGQTTRVTPGGNDWTWRQSISDDGRHVAYRRVSASQVFVHDRDVDGNGVFDEPAGTTTRLVAGGTQTEQPTISSDGRFVVFWSSNRNLVAAPTNDCGWCQNNRLDTSGNCADGPTCPHVFVQDRDSDGNGVLDEPGGTTLSRASVDSLGNLGDGWNRDPRVSEHGRYVSFSSDAPNLVPDDTNGLPDLFVHDRITGETVRVNLSSEGVESDRHTDSNHAISDDGRFLAFVSHGTALVPGDTNGQRDVFIRDRDVDENGIFDEPDGVSTTRVSVDSLGRQTSGTIFALEMSHDGRFVVFSSGAPNLVPEDSNGNIDVFVHDRFTGHTQRVSVDSNGSEANGDSFNNANALAVSSDGFTVAFATEADNLVPGDENRFCDGGNGSGTLNCEDVMVRAPAASDISSDLTLDGDLRDTVLEVFDSATQQRTTLCPAGDVAIEGTRAAFLRPESAGIAAGCPVGAADPEDLDGDGDAADRVVHLYTHGGSVENLGVAARSIALSGSFLVALASDALGDQELRVYDLATSAWRSPGVPADSADVSGNIVALISPEYAAGGVDLNGDADRDDRVFQLYDATLEELIPVGRAAEEFVIGERIAAFRTSECAEGGGVIDGCPTGGTDLNGDGDAADAVLQVYDLESRTLFNTGQAVIPCRFEACDPRVPYRISGDTVTFLTREEDQGGQDLDGNGDAGGIVLQAFNTRVAGGAAEAAPNFASLAAPAASAAVAAPTSVTPLAGSASGVCTDTAEACASDAGCPAGRCFLPPGGCIEELDRECTCSENSCSGCDTASSEFCVPLLGAPSEGRCQVDRGPCASTGDCLAPAVCRDGARDVVRLVSPLAPQDDGKQVFVSAALQIARPDSASSRCLADEHCPTGEVCTDAGTCQMNRVELIVAGAPDSDGDGVADPFDNCPRRRNPDQSDADADGIGDRCDLEGGPDADLDGWPDGVDNCPGRANDGQTDSNANGFGNACDADYDADGLAGGRDFNSLRLAFGSSRGDQAYNPAVDCNADDVIDHVDLGCFASGFGLPPGTPLGDPAPSGAKAASLPRASAMTSGAVRTSPVELAATGTATALRAVPSDRRRSAPLVAPGAPSDAEPHPSPDEPQRKPVRRSPACGLGFELALVLPLGMWARARSRRRGRALAPDA